MAAAKPSSLVDTRVVYCGDNLDQLRKLPAPISVRAMTVRSGKPNKQTKQTDMKKLLMLTVMSCALAAQTIPAFADATAAQKDQIERARKEMHEALKTEEGCKTMCEEMMKNDKTKKMMCEMIAKDPEAMKMMKTK